MTDFIAYHSAERMGYEYEPKGDFHFFSRKPESYLRSAIGCRVWTLSGKRDRKGHTVFRLAGVFTPSTVNPEIDGFGIAGEGTLFRPQIDVTSEPWLAELRREQNNFSFGFNRIRRPVVIDALLRIQRDHACSDLP